MKETYRIIGVESSPYTVKVRAVMRFRRLPHVWLSRMPQYFGETLHVRPLLMPVVQFPDGTYRTDTTPIILDLERLHPNGRSIVPTDPAAAFLSLLIEDMADEWLSKCLFHNRFSKPENRSFAPAWVMDDAHPGLSRERLEELTAKFLERQTNRMPLFGCIPENAELFETFYHETLAALESMAATDRFLFGTRPSLADFGLYGQLTTLAADPTSMAVMRRTAPRTEHWVRRLDDGSGIDGDWSETGASAVVVEFIAMAGRFYLPFLEANANAVAERDESFRVELAGQSYTQPAGRYQSKCLDFLRAQFARLNASERGRITGLLDETGCLEVLEAS